MNGTESCAPHFYRKLVILSRPRGSRRPLHAPGDARVQDRR